MVINPAMSSAASLINAQTTSIAPPPTEKMTDKTSTTSSAGGNSTVTLSEKAQKISTGVSNELQETQRVGNAEATETRTQESNETYSGVGAGSMMQSKANVYAAIQQQTNPLPA